MSDFNELKTRANKLATRMRILSELTDNDKIRKNGKELLDCFEKTIKSIASLNGDMSEERSRFITLRDELDRKQVNLDRKQVNLDRKQADLDHKQADLDSLDKIQKRLKTLNIQSNELVALEKSGSKKLIQEINLLKSSGESSNQSLGTKLDESIEGFKAYRDEEFQNLSTVTEGLRKELQVANSSLETVKEEMAILERNNGELVVERITLTGDLQVKLLEIDQAKKEAESLVAKTIKLEEDLDTNKAQVKSKDTVISRLEQDLAIKNEKVDESERKINDYEQNVKDYERKVEAKAAETDELRQELETTNKKLSEVQNTADEASTFNLNLIKESQALKEEKRRASILLRPPQKRQRLDWESEDDEDDAQKTVETERGDWVYEVHGITAFLLQVQPTIEMGSSLSLQDAMSAVLAVSITAESRECINDLLSSGDTGWYCLKQLSAYGRTSPRSWINADGCCALHDSCVQVRADDQAGDTKLRCRMKA